MIFECLFYNGNFIIAKEACWIWSMAEKSKPFEIVEVNLPSVAIASTPIVVDTSGGAVVLSAGQINPTLNLFPGA